jgi:hypothetical protein
MDHRVGDSVVSLVLSDGTKTKAVSIILRNGEFGTREAFRPGRAKRRE